MKKYSSNGFSLIELAIVLAVIGLFVGGAIGAYGRWAEKQRYEQAVEDIEIAKKAIIGYAISNGFLPCSDISSAIEGNEDRTGGQCTALAAGEFRVLPYADLSVEGFDPWGTVYRYRAHPNYSDSANLFTLIDINGLTVNDGGDDGVPPQDVATNVAFVVYSIGLDQGRNDTIQQDENLDNIGADDDLFSKPPTFLPFNENDPADVNDNTGFDDVISWVSTHELKLYMLEAGQLPRN